MPSNQDRIRTLVDLGTETARTDGGWQLDNIRFAIYPDGHWVIASLDRDAGKPVVHANSREAMRRILEGIMNEMERHVSQQVEPSEV
jgi:hypothetical protein